MVMAYIAMAYIVIAYILMAYIAMAYIVTANIVMADVHSPPCLVRPSWHHRRHIYCSVIDVLFLAVAVERWSWPLSGAVAVERCRGR